MDSMNERSAVDELAAAEAELKAAQERLDAARLRMASEQPQPYAQPADAPVDSQGAQSKPQPYAQAPYAAQPAQPASFGSQSQPQQPTQPTAAWQPDAQQAQGQPYVQQPGAQQPAQPYAAPQQGSPYAQPQPQAQPAQQPYGAQPGYGSVPPQNPYGQQAQYGYQQPYVAPAVGEKDHVAAGLLALFLRLARRAQVLPGLQHLGLHHAGHVHLGRHPHVVGGFMGHLGHRHRRGHLLSIEVPNRIRADVRHQQTRMVLTVPLACRPQRWESSGEWPLAELVAAFFRG